MRSIGRDSRQSITESRFPRWSATWSGRARPALTNTGACFSAAPLVIDCAGEATPMPAERFERVAPQLGWKQKKRPFQQFCLIRRKPLLAISPAE